MSDIEKRLRASVRFAAINGDSRERAICGRQMLEAANYIQQLEAERMARLSAPEPATVAVDAGALEALREAVAVSTAHTGCLDGFCLVTGGRAGMHTNGGCRCWRNQPLVQRVMQDRLKLLEAAHRLLAGGE